MALLIVVTGPPGAGKSTVARALASEFDRGALVEGDAFFAFITRGAVAPWLPAAHAQNEIVTRAAAVAAGGYAAGGYDTVYDGVVGPWFLPTFVGAAGVERLHYAVLLPPAGQCLERIASRTGHGFTDQGAARQMHDQFASSAIDPRHVLRNAPDKPGTQRGTSCGAPAPERSATPSNDGGATPAPRAAVPRGWEGCLCRARMVIPEGTRAR